MKEDIENSTSDFFSRVKSEGAKVGIATVVESIHKLEVTEENIKALQDKYPELSLEIEKITSSLYKPFKDRLSSVFFVGTIRQGDEQYPFVNFVDCGFFTKDISRGRNFIFIPGQGTQLYNTGDYNGEDRNNVETYVHYAEEVDGTELFTERSTDVDKRRVMYHKEIQNENGKKRYDASIGMHAVHREFDREQEIAVESNYPNRLTKQIGFTQYGKDRNYYDTGDNVYSAEYGLLYSSAQARLPIRIYKKINGDGTVYELKSGTNKYNIIHVKEKGNSRGKDVVEDTTAISFEEFEKSMQAEYGIGPITGSELDKRFFEPEKYPVPDVITKIVEGCKALERTQREMNEGHKI